MTRKPIKLSLEYLDNKINRLSSRLNKFEETIFAWERKRDEEIDELKKAMQGGEGK